MNPAARTFVCSFSCGRTLPFLLGLDLGAEVLGHMVTLGLTVGGTASPYSTDRMPPGSSDFCTPPPTQHLSVLSMPAVLVGVQWDLIVVLIRVSPWLMILSTFSCVSFREMSVRLLCPALTTPPTVRSPPTVHPTSRRVTLHPCQRAEG